MTGYGAKKNAGLYLSQLRDECTHRFGANQHQDDRLRTNITGCILETFTEYDKALFASRQYILTLWPAFVGAIVALAPDPASMIYDNIWWTGLFCITCGGLPGLDMASSPPHHVEVHSEVDGRAMCETWRYDSARPRALSRSRTMGSATRGAGHVRMEWIAYSIGIALWVAFIVFFGATLYGSATDFAFGGDWLAGAAWYYISASPAVLAACFELWHNRVDLYKPVDNVNTSDGSGATSNTLVVDSSVELQQHYERVKQCQGSFGRHFGRMAIEALTSSCLSTTLIGPLNDLLNAYNGSFRTGEQASAVRGLRRDNHARGLPRSQQLMCMVGINGRTTELDPRSQLQVLAGAGPGQPDVGLKHLRHIRERRWEECYVKPAGGDGACDAETRYHGAGDAVGREWDCGGQMTANVRCTFPTRPEASYTLLGKEKGQEKRTIADETCAIDRLQLRNLARRQHELRLLQHRLDLGREIGLALEQRRRKRDHLNARQHGRDNPRPHQSKGGSSLNPFVDSSTSAAATTSASAPAASGSAASSSSENAGGVAGPESGATGYTLTPAQIADLKRHQRALIAHGCLMALAFVIFYPLGGILVRLLHVKGTVWIHAGVQAFAYTLTIAGMGCGVYVTGPYGYNLDHKHTIIGLTVIAAFFIQPFFGVIHHAVFKKTGRRSFWSDIHVWFGRLVLTLGIINGGLGFDWAANTTGGEIAYGVVAGVVWVGWIGVAVWSDVKRLRGGAGGGGGGEGGQREKGSQASESDG
ncbi:uncharacterized protein KY384_004705 [Bacidia gigantensis]|uniref:uncharacterized protein n=1 Tax=Bacidia gigantensis TaxID=2732470 RepID=UPI001D043696|nr:uncharacterized protein KY384_004705 [Bacidia gigantensis]KAG8530205.1 hypothetical protein KY384_004705 [Bacidia gigantensis]